MSVSGLVAAGTVLANIAAKIFTTTKMDENYKAVSLTQRAKKCFIESKAYIDKDIEHEKVMPGLMKHVLGYITSLTLTSLRLDNLVSDGVTISDRLRSVATERYTDVVSNLKRDSLALEGLATDILSGNIMQDTSKLERDLRKAEELRNSRRETREAFKEKIAQVENAIQAIDEQIGQEKTNLIAAPKPGKNAIKVRISQLENEKHKLLHTLSVLKSDNANAEAAYQEAMADYDREVAEVNRIHEIGITDVTPSSDVSLSKGVVKEITLKGPNGATYVVPIYVKVNAEVVNSEQISYLMEVCGHALTSAKRRVMLSAGEITFIKDFLFGMDLIKRMQRLVKSDKTGNFAAFTAKTAGKDNKRVHDTLLKLADDGRRGYKSSSNLANAVLIFSEKSVKDGQRRGGVNLNNPKERQRFFEKSYASMIFVLDPSHELITMYMNGFDSVGHFPYSEFLHKKDLDSEDFMSVLRAVSSDNLSKF